MGISPNLLQSVADQLSLLIGFLVAALVVQVVPAIQIKIPRPRVPGKPGATTFLRVIPALGIVAATALPSGASVLQRRPHPSWAQASSQVETDGPPPLPSVRPRRVERETDVHPAIHPGARVKGPLFPRAHAALKNNQTQRERAMDLHPAGKTLHHETYEVQLGDTLWDIAASVLKTDDNARIARFWPRLHRANVDVLGKDPNRIYPGQILRLPKEEA